jgi:hypothetical protein
MTSATEPKQGGGVRPDFQDRTAGKQAHHVQHVGGRGLMPPNRGNSGADTTFDAPGSGKPQTGDIKK